MRAYAYLPEVLNHSIILCVTSIIGVFLPVINVDVCYASDEQLQFALIEDIDEIRRYKLVEASNEGVKLLIHTLLDAPFCDKLHILLLVLVRDLNVAATRF